MNAYREDNSSHCYFHPKEIVIGVCPLCLNERLLILATKQGHHPSHRRTTATTTQADRKPPINLPKIFALGSLLNRLEFRHSKSDNYSDDQYVSTSQEDSFISIKFEDNGVASWEKGTLPSNKVSLEQYWENTKSLNHNSKEAKQGKDSKEEMSVIEHDKPRASLRWRKRIGHLFQLIVWKRSNNKGHVGGKREGVKVGNKGWIRTLTKRRTKE